jgi:exopolysaccharide production protein ExoY
MDHASTSISLHPSPDRGGSLLRVEPISGGELRTWFEPQTVSRNVRPSTALKRLIDILGAAAAILALSPLLIVLLVVLAVGTRGRPLFVQQRIGRYGSPFRLCKFRTMARNADLVLREHLERDSRLAEEWAIARKLHDDPRVTRMGRLLRRYSLDELPQFFNVLVGHMSLVGPRPILIEETPRFGDRLWTVLSVRPGLTGLWSVSGRNDISYEERVRLEHRYVTQWTLGRDLAILMRTVPAVVRGHGAY